MADLARTARRLAPRLSSPAFDTAFSQLATARVVDEQAPRNPKDVTQLAHASARLADARSDMQTTLHGPRAS